MEPIILGVASALLVMLHIIPIFYVTSNRRLRHGIVTAFNVVFFGSSAYMIGLFIVLSSLVSVVVAFGTISKFDGFYQKLALEFILSVAGFLALPSAVITILRRNTGDQGYLGLAITSFAALGALVSPMVKLYITEEGGKHVAETGSLVLASVYFGSLLIAVILILKAFWGSRGVLLQDLTDGYTSVRTRVTAMALKEKEFPSATKKK